MPRPVKWLLWIAATASGLAVLLAITLAMILNTASGTRWAIEHVTAQLPGELRIKAVDGTLWKGLTMSGLTYSDAERAAEAVNVNVRIDWPAILSGRLAIGLLQADYIEYRSMAAKPAAADPFVLEFSPLPMAISLGHGNVGSVVLRDGESVTELRDILLDDSGIDGNAVRAGFFSVATGMLTVTVTDLDARLEGDVPIRATASWKTSDGKWSGRGAAQGSLRALEFEQAVAGPYPAEVSGVLHILHRVEPEFDALVRWDSWSFGDVAADTGAVRIQGVAEDYAATYDLVLQMPGKPRAEVSGTAAGGTEGLSAANVAARSPIGDANFDGSVTWLPAFGAEGAVRVTGVNPAALMPTVTGRLDADARITLDDAGNLLLNDVNIEGTLNGVALTSRGDISLTPDQVRCSDCSLSAGENRLSVSGTYSDEAMELTLAVDAPSLHELLPELAGSVVGAGQLLGTISAPSFTGELNASRFHFAGWSVGELFVESRQVATDSLDVSATATNLARGETGFGSIVLHGQGRPDLLDVDVDWQFRDLGAVAAINLRRDQGVITGRILDATISEPNISPWSLSAPVVFHIDGDDVVVEPHSWSGPGGQLRLERLSRSEIELAVEAYIVDLPLQLANPFLPQNYELDGLLNADIQFVQQDGVWTGFMDWSQTATVVHIREAFEQSTDVTVPEVEVRIDVTRDVATIAATLAIDPGVSATLDARLTQLLDDPLVTAELRMQGEQWHWLPAVIPEIDNFEGMISAAVNATGRLMAPDFSGEMTWRQGSLVVPTLNVPFRDIDLVVAGASDGSATLAGSLKAGGGELAADGHFSNLISADRSLRLTLRGDTAELMNWPEYRLWASPDLVVVGAGDGWQVNGQLAIPQAEIRLRELPAEAVRPSPDVIVSGEITEQTKPTRYSGEVTLLLGDRIHLQALGLDSNLTGNLVVKKQYDRAPTAEGRIELVGGIFSAYGQKLTIETGNLTFTGPPDDPIVDVRAVRVIESFEETVTAGIQLRGRASNLTSTIFSDPAMSEGDALSYLMIGRPLAQATEAEGGDLSGAAIGLGLRQATRITEQIGQSIGLDQLSLTGDGGDNTTLIAGKQINPQLYARYAYNVFSRLGTLLLHYKLSQHLALEASAGETQSIDVLYSIEK